MDSHTRNSDPPAPRRRRWRRRLLIGGIAALGLIVVAIALAPVLAGWVAPGYIERAIAPSINGTVAVQRVGLSWFGRQRLGPLIIRDDRGAEAVRASVEVTRNMAGLMGGAVGVTGLDVGEVRVRASANVVREPDGSLNLARLFAKEEAPRVRPAPGPGPVPQPAEPTRVPPSLEARVIIEDLDLVFEDRAPDGDPAARVVRLQNATGEGFFAPGQPLTFSLTGAATYGPDAQSPGTPAGDLKISATVKDLVDASGLVTVDQAKFDAAVEAVDFAVAPADALARMRGALVEGLGERVTLSLNATGTPGDATAEIKAAAQGLDADLALRYVETGGAATLTASRPGSVRVHVGALRALVPGLKESLDRQQIATVTSWPDLAVALEDLRLQLPKAGAGLDLRGSSIALKVDTGPMSGEVVTPGPEGAAAGPRQPFTLAPFAMSVESKDLSGPVRVRGEGSATIGDQPAGSLVIDMSASGLLDEAGRPVAGPPRALSGTVLLKGVSTVLAQPLVEGAGLDLPRDIGPTIDVDLRARARADQGAPAAIPATDLDLTVRGAKLQTVAAIEIDERGLRGRAAEGRPAVDMTVASAAAVAGRLAQRAGAARITGRGPLTVAVSDLDIPFAPGSATPALDQATARMTIGLNELSVLPLYKGTAGQAAPVAPDAPPLAVREFRLTGVLAPGSAPLVALNAQLAHGESPFAVTGDFALEGLVRPGEPGAAPVISAGTLRPVGTLAIQNAPTSLARLMPPPAPDPGGGAPLDLAALIQDGTGPSITVEVETSVAKARADRLNVVSRIESAGLKGAINGGIVPDAILLDKTDLRASVTPELASSVLAIVAPTMDPRPTLAERGVLTIGIDPLRIPLAPGGFSPDLAGAGDVTARIGLEGRLMVDNVQVRNADGTVRDVGAVGVEGMRIIVAAPLKALAQAGPGGAGVGKAEVKARLLAGSPPDRLADLDATAQSEIAGGRPVGALASTIRVSDVATAAVDRIIQQPGLLSTALGPTVSAEATARARFPSTAAAAPGLPYEQIDVTGTFESPAMRTARPFQATVRPDRVGLEAPLVVNWTMSPEFANARVLGLPADAPGAGAPATGAPSASARAPPAAKFVEPTALTLTVNRLALGPADAPLKPGVFALDAEVQAPAVSMVVGDGTPARFGTLRMRVGEQKRQGSIGYTMKVEAAPGGGGGGEVGGAPIDVSGGVHQLADEAGRLTMDRAVLNAKVAAHAVPTALVDALARQSGLLVELLGPTVTLDANAADLPLAGTSEQGAVTARMTSERADAALRGVIRDGMFIAQAPISTQLNVITPELGARLVKGLPQLASVQKATEDGPAVLTATRFTFPVDGDWRKLNGDLTFNLGLVRFETSGRFQKILKVLDQREAGLLGRKVEPFHAVFENGVMTYDRYKIPLGEFSVETVGRVDLAARTLDVITFVPLGALTDEAAGLFNTRLGALTSRLPILGPTTMLPWRTHGSFQDPHTEPDVEAYVKNLGQKLNPLDLLKNIGERINGREGGGREGGR